MQYRRFRFSTISYTKNTTRKRIIIQGKAVKNYNSITKKALEYNDFVTYNLATQILADEVKDEQRTEDILKNLEVK